MIDDSMMTRILMMTRKSTHMYHPIPIVVTVVLSIFVCFSKTFRVLREPLAAFAYPSYKTLKDPGPSNRALGPQRFKSCPPFQKGQHGQRVPATRRQHTRHASFEHEHTNSGNVFSVVLGIAALLSWPFLFCRRHV
ncbi:hypothetical protein V8E53_005113 [Lactarius tabidus]